MSNTFETMKILIDKLFKKYYFFVHFLQLLCRSGCNCKKGYVRRSDNSEECILRDDCLNNRLIGK